MIFSPTFSSAPFSTCSSTSCGVGTNDVADSKRGLHVHRPHFHGTRDRAVVSERLVLVSSGSSPWERGEWPVHSFNCQIATAQRNGWWSVLPPICTCGAEASAPPPKTETFTTDQVTIYRDSDTDIEIPITDLNFRVEWDIVRQTYRASCTGHPGDYVEARNPVRALALMIQQIREMEKA